MNEAVLEVNQNEVAPAVFYSQHVGVIFNDSDDIASNKFLVEALSSMPEDSVNKRDGKTAFNVLSRDLGYFMHMIFAHMPEGQMLQSTFDGIYQFEAPDEQGNPALFNAQMLTLNQISVPMPE